MPISKENVIFAYRSGDTNSFNIASKYKSLHDLDAEQLVGIPCSDIEILANENTFNNEVLDPIKDAISSLSNRRIWAIITGFNVPGGFHHGPDIIATTSRLSRIHHDFQKQLRNYLFDRAAFKRFDRVDARFALVTSRIDAATLDITSDFLDRTSEFKKQSTAKGKFYIDPYSGILGADAAEYQNEILDFVGRELVETNLEVFSTVFLDPYIDVVLPFVKDDSFTWSWFADRSSLSFFQATNSARLFFYNADYDGAFTVRDVNDRRWPLLAMRSDYISTAGAMSNPTIDGLLRPRPFFRALLDGATTGEAMLYSTKFVDWTMSFFGDPLLQVHFPGRTQVITFETPAELFFL